MTPELKLVAIHQPSFLPWLGYFDKILRSDIFVILDNVQFQKTGGTWSNRVKILVSGSPQWITIPVKRNYNGFRNINEMKIDETKPWRDKLLRSIEINYKKTPFFNEVFPVLNELLLYRNDDLTAFNLNIIYKFCDLLGIQKDKIVVASKLKCESSSTELLISIVKSLKANAYMCGGGAFKYQDDKLFEQEGIKLVYQNFQYPVYSQFNTKIFETGLSVLDVFMNCGFGETRNLLS